MELKGTVWYLGGQADGCDRLVLVVVVVVVLVVVVALVLLYRVCWWVGDGWR